MRFRRLDSRHVDAQRISLEAELHAAPGQGDYLGGPDQVLAWQAGDVGTGATEQPALYNYRSTTAIAGPCSKFASDSAADNQVVILLNVSHLIRLPDRMSREIPFRKVDWDPRDVAHVVLENVQCDVGDRLDDFAVAQTAGTGAREVCVGEFTTLDDDAAREFEDGIGSGVGRARANRVVDFSLIQSDFRSHRRVRTQAVRAQVALGDRQRELLANFFIEGSAGERRAQAHESFKRCRRSRKNAKQIRHQREFRAYLCEESPDRAGCMIGIDWLDAILVSGSAHRRLSADCSRSNFRPSARCRKAGQHGSLLVNVSIARHALPVRPTNREQKRLRLIECAGPVPEEFAGAAGPAHGYANTRIL